MYCASASAAHGITVATARRRGGLPRIAFPNRTWHTPGDPSSGAAGFGAKSATSSIAASRRRDPAALSTCSSAASKNACSSPLVSGRRSGRPSFSDT
jgi:hypothetical protein